MESEFSSAFRPLYADVSVLSNDAVGFPEIPFEVVAGGEEGLLVVPPPAPLAPPPCWWAERRRARRGSPCR